MLKMGFGLALSFMAISDLITWIKRGKPDAKAVWNSIADILIIIYTVI